VPILLYTPIGTPLAQLIRCKGRPPQLGQNHPPRGESGFVDGSGPLFSMYLQLAGEEDKKMTENWKGDADGILIFVSHHSTSGTFTHTHTKVEDRFILCRRRNISRRVCPGPQAQLTGHLSVLPRKHLSSPHRSEWLPGPYSPTFQPFHPIFSPSLCRMGQLTLVSQPGHQSHMRTFGNITAAVGASVHEGHPDTIQSTQTSAHPCVLCGGCRQTSPSVGSRSVAWVVTPLSIPLLRGPGCVPFQHQPYGFQRGRVVGRILYRRVHVHHILAGVSA